LSNADKGAIGFISAQELAILTKSSTRESTRGDKEVCGKETVNARSSPIFLFKLKFPNYCLGSGEYKSFNKNRVRMS